ncbi:MAG: transglutaminase domain-containing protein, partial [Candidatus Aminicenantes bacterium]|nr:transglutaminase domain-containing protein [Candidatus Aminicenantes bacterium]
VQGGGLERALIDRFLRDTQRGTSEQFATSFVLLARSLGIEARLFIPALRVPFRLIFAYNNKKIYASDSEFTFRFAVGTTF